MSRNEAFVFLLVIGLVVTACERDSTGDPTGPESPPAGPSEAVTQAAPRANYIAINLSKKAGTAMGINAVGQVVGSYMTTLQEGNVTYPVSHAFVWKDGVFRDLGTLGGRDSYGTAINDAGQVTGESAPPGQFVNHAFLWQSGTMRDLGTLGGPASGGTGINSKGQIVGYSSIAGGSVRAFLWQAGTMKRLLGLENTLAKAHGIDNNSRIVGERGQPSTSRGFRWIAGTVRSIGTFGGASSIAKAISQENKVVGWAATASGSFHAYIWRAGVMTDLGTLGGSSSGAYAINAVGQIVGESAMPSGLSTHGFLWQNGVMYDVDQGRARGINLNGWIVGDKINPALTGHTNFVPTLWKPTDSPPTPPPAGLIRVGGTFFASSRNGTWDPAVDTVAVGRTVTWDWFGGTHSVQSTGSPSFTSSAVMNGGASQHTFTFSKVGTYQYNCALHPSTMFGRIIVK